MPTLPAGEYVITDPCYAWSNDRYAKILNDTKFLSPDGVFTERDSGRQFAIFSTDHGDGVYQDNLGNSYSVDAGCIGCIPAEIVDKLEPWMAVIKFENNFDVSSNNGVIYYGHISINTGW